MPWDEEVGDLQALLASLKAEVAQVASSEPIWVPSVTEFGLSPFFLAKEYLYPRQAVMLKSIFLERESFTEFEADVAAEWRSGFTVGEPDDLLGGWWFVPSGATPDAQGTTPDLFERIDVVRQGGRRWFPHVNFVGGRRCGKGEIAAFAIVYALWHLLALDEPQAFVHAARGKTLTIDLFAGNQAQARFNVFADVVRTIINAPCFAPYICELRRDSLRLATPFDRRTGRQGTIEIHARESTLLAGRGQSAIVQVFDEMAWITPGTSKAPAEELYAAANPALDQARDWSLTLTISSPYQQQGMFFELNARARELDPATGRAMYPEMVTFQFPSWAPYSDWELAPELPVVNGRFAATSESEWLRLPDGSVRTFPAAGGPVSVYDDRMRQEERADPIRFRVERRGQWANVVDPYLNSVWIDDMWVGPTGERLHRQDDGPLSIDYIAHLDPASRHDAFALVIGHDLVVNGRRYAIFDHIRRWQPDGDVLDLEAVLDEIAVILRNFNPISVTVDQYGGDFVVAGLRQRLSGRTPKAVTIAKRSHTVPLDGETTVLFHDLMRVGAVRSYYDRQLDLELRYLQDRGGKVSAPTTGPVTTDDVADAAIVVAATLLHPTKGLIRRQFSDSPLHARPGLEANDPIAQAFSDVSRRAFASQAARPASRRPLPPPPPRRRRFR